MKKGVSGFQPDRLNQALEARGMSQLALASALDLSATTISRWKSGKQSPEGLMLHNLASALKVQPDWLIRPTPEQSSSPTLFRSNASALKSARVMLQARMWWTQELFEGFSNYVDFPEVDIPQLDVTDPNAISDDEIEEVALRCRRRWGLGLGPVPDVVLAIENAGGVVVRETTGIAKIEGLSNWSESLNRPFIYLNADKGNAFRSRFDASHELGHVVMHRNVPRNLANTPSVHKEMERQAHYFASCFLMPAETFLDEMPSEISLETLLGLKIRWGASVAAMQMRLFNLGILSADENLKLHKRRSARFGGKQEPLDDARPPEQPRLLNRTVSLLLESGLFNKADFSRFFGISERDIEAFAALPEGFLSIHNPNLTDINQVRIKRVK